jgi:transposase
MLDLDITSIKRTDYQDAREKISDIEEGDLIIRDLGYFSNDVIREISARKTFFLSRLKTNLSVYDQEINNISFSKLYSKMVRNNFSHTEMKVFVGQKEKISSPMRFFVSG